VIIIGTMIVFRQLGYAQTKYLGFNKEQVLVVNRAYGLKDNQKLFKNNLLKNPSVKMITFGYNMPGQHHNQQGHHIVGRPDQEWSSIFVAWGDYDYIRTLGFEIVEGRDFNPEMPTDTFAAIVNEEMVRFFDLEDPLDTRFDYSPWPAIDSIDYKIIGVVKDFHYYSLHDKIEPWILYPLREDLTYYAYHALIKFDTDDVQSVVKLAEEQWQKFVGDFPFDYSFLDQDFQHQYDKDIKARKMFTVFSIFAIIIACLGLLGLSSFATNQRTREIGIRKAMGSSGKSIILLFALQFSKWVLISNIIAWPIAWYFMQKWLNNFAFRIKMPWHYFFLAGLITLVIALLTVIYHSWAASRKNPVDALRYE
jgi:putative ABC transport system permease protein